MELESIIQSEVSQKEKNSLVSCSSPIHLTHRSKNRRLKSKRGHVIFLPISSPLWLPAPLEQNPGSFSRPARPALPIHLFNPLGYSNSPSSGYSEFLQFLSCRLCSLRPSSQESSPLPPLSLLGLNVPSEEALSGHQSRIPAPLPPSTFHSFPSWAW